MTSHALSDIDPYFVQSISALYQKDHLERCESSLLQRRLEEAIFNKYGLKKDFSPLLATVVQRPIEDVKIIEESKTTSSSDNELELDLFNEDLSCVVCQWVNVHGLKTAFLRIGVSL